jgi:large subunit ribosomal protein L25
MKSVALKAYPRSQVQRAEVKKLRTAGRVPATIYGRQAKPQNLEVNSKESDLLHHSVSENLLVDLSVENDARAKRLALVQEIQHHPLDGKVLHVDFHEISEDEKVTVHVPVETTGEAAGVKNGGGVLEHVLFKLKVRCLPERFAGTDSRGRDRALKSASPFTSAISRRRKALKFWATSTFP